MKNIKCFTMIAAVGLFSAVGCMNGRESNSGEPVVTTPSASSSASGSAVSPASPATNSSLSIADSSYNSDTIRIDSLRK